MLCTLLGRNVISHIQLRATIMTKLARYLHQLHSGMSVVGVTSHFLILHHRTELMSDSINWVQKL